MVDHLKTCNEHNLPVEDFRRLFCCRCLRQECSRAEGKGSRFEDRVQAWLPRLFTQVPRMSEKDPRFEDLSKQKFVEIPTGGPLEIQSAEWIDPNAPVEGPPETEPTPEVVEEDPRTADTDPAPAPNTPPVPVQENVPPPLPKPPPMPNLEGQLNTPARQGIMLDGARTRPSPPPVADSWAAPVTRPKAAPGEKIVNPGARIRFGAGVKEG